MPEPVPEIPVLFQTDELIAVDKPDGMAAIPERGEVKDDLLTVLSATLGKRLYVVHRIDKGVTGVILFAKTPEAHKSLNDQFAARTVKKTYAALVHGVVKADQGRIDKPIRKFGSGRMGVDIHKGVTCVTEFSVAERFPCYTLLEVRPVSGRRHQIRVHLYASGHPIVGDRLYGDRRFQKPFERLMLHARAIEFERVPGERVRVEAPVPAEFTRVVDLARAAQKPITTLPDFVWEKIGKKSY